MQKTISLKLLPSEATDEGKILQHAASASGQPATQISGFNTLKRSIDARGRQAWVLLTLELFIGEPFQKRKFSALAFQDVTRAKYKVIIVGAGPAGLFAALRFLELGIQPIVLERGKDIRARRRDLASLNKEGIINPESNYCFGEGGAGTYSDGKLYTRSNKRGDIHRVLNILVQFGAGENILYESHPHIGTNKLPAIIGAIRKQILDCGGIFLFEKKVIDFTIKNDRVARVTCSDHSEFEAEAVILATGHSARDVFELLHRKKIRIDAKSFALGVRIEHPQILIDSIQYHHDCRPTTPSRKDPDLAHLPPASYSLVQQVDGKGVFSFCMCPGGIIAPASTAAGELVVNGWSPSKRNNPFANSGIVVSVDEKDLQPLKQYGPLAGIHFQQEVEKKAFQAGGGKMVAPAQRMADFVDKKISSSLPACSYLPGIHACSLKEVLPGFIYKSLQESFVAFGKKMKGYYTNEAVVVATESRTSSPVRIPRDPISLEHPQLRNLYPCGEGAGYAGGIVSAAMDGESVASRIAEKLSEN
jgi:uncharacterized protein